MDHSRPPRDNLYRAVAPGPEFRADTAAGPPMLVGHFARFNEWNEIDSWIEGRFLERVAPGAYARTLKNKGSKMPVLFQHGHDPELGDKVIATPEVLREDEEGPYYEARLLEGLPPLVMSGLRENRYGASYRFRVLKEDFEAKPKRGEHNPEGLPERTIQEAEVYEFGPVTFPADPGATAAVRSLTDAYTGIDAIRGLLKDPDRAQRLLELRPDLAANDPALASALEDALPDDGPGDSHSDEGTRAKEPPAPPVDPPPVAAEPTPQDPPNGGSLSVRETKPTMQTIEEVRERLSAVNARLTEIHTEVGADGLGDHKEEWDALNDERAVLTDREQDYEQRASVVQAIAAKPTNVQEGTGPKGWSRTRKTVPDNIFDVAEYRNLNSSVDGLRQAYIDGALKATEASVFPHENADENKIQRNIERLLAKDNQYGEFAQRLITTGSPAYMRAFGKYIAARPLTTEDQRALATVGSTQLADGGYAIPFQLDPSIILTTDGSVNPLRQIARTEQITSGNTWKGVTSAGITVSRGAEEAAVTDNAPTIAQPSVTVQSVKTLIKFSIEADQDWTGLQSEMARVLQEAKDDEEADSFINGVGTTVYPAGVVQTLDASSHVGTTGNGFTADDVYRLEERLGPKYRARASFIANKAVFNAIRQFDTAGGAQLWARIGEGQPSELLGYPAYEASAMESDYATDTNPILLIGDFRNFLIVDKVGLSVELIPHVVDGSGNPTGQRGLFAYWRNSSLVLNDAAFRLLLVGVVTS